jgi:heat shock protein HtpX
VFKRVALFAITNLAILFVLNLVLLGVESTGVFGEGGLSRQYGPLMVMSALLGMGGSFFSLLISKWMAKRAMGAHVIETPRNATEAWLVETVRRQAQAAGIGMPEVAIYDAPEMNAFATGASKNKALVAVSTGLLQQMKREEVEAVLGHEVSHVANGDMVTLTLIQGVVNTFVIFLARVVGHTVDRVVFKNEEGHGPAFWIATIVAEIVFGLLATIIVMHFSRQREFRADAGGAKLAGREHMIGALERLRQRHAGPLPDKMAAFGISGGGAAGLKKLFMTHPPLEDRIAALRAGPT